MQPNGAGVRFSVGKNEVVKMVLKNATLQCVYEIWVWFWKREMAKPLPENVTIQNEHGPKKCKMAKLWFLIQQNTSEQKGIKNRNHQQIKKA